MLIKEDTIFHRCQIFTFRKLENVGRVILYNIRNGEIRWQIPDFLTVGSNNVCFIFHHLRDIRKSNKMQSLTLKMKVSVKEEKTSHSTGCYLATYLYAKGNDTQTHTARQG